MQIHLCLDCQKLAVAYVLDEPVKDLDEKVLTRLEPKLDEFFWETGHYTFKRHREIRTCEGCENAPTGFLWTAGGDLFPLSFLNVIELLNDEGSIMLGQCSVATENETLYVTTLSKVPGIIDWSLHYETLQEALDCLAEKAQHSDKDPQYFLHTVGKIRVSLALKDKRGY